MAVAGAGPIPRPGPAQAFRLAWPINVLAGGPHKRLGWTRADRPGPTQIKTQGQASRIGGL